MNSSDYIEINNLLDTTRTRFIESFEVIDYYVLREMFGEPVKVEYCDEIEYEWKILINERLYSIYNWNEDGKNKKELVEEKKFHISGIYEREEDILKLKKYIRMRELEYLEEEFKRLERENYNNEWFDEIIKEYL